MGDWWNPIPIRPSDPTLSGFLMSMGFLRSVDSSATLNSGSIWHSFYCTLRITPKLWPRTKSHNLGQAFNAPRTLFHRKLLSILPDRAVDHVRGFGYFRGSHNFTEPWTFIHSRLMPSVWWNCLWRWRQSKWNAVSDLRGLLRDR